MMATRQSRFTPEELAGVYARRLQAAEFIRQCLPTAAALRAGLIQWDRMVRVSVRIPQTTNPDARPGSEGQGA